MSRRLPYWFTQGKPGNIKSCPDAEYILEDDEFDWKWRRCEVPTVELYDYVKSDWDTFFQGICPTESREQEKARCEKIVAWFNEVGSALRALRRNPIIVVIDGDRIRLLDGTHRAALAVHKARLSKIPAFVAVVPR